MNSFSVKRYVFFFLRGVKYNERNASVPIAANRFERGGIIENFRILGAAKICAFYFKLSPLDNPIVWVH